MKLRAFKIEILVGLAIGVGLGSAMDDLVAGLLIGFALGVALSSLQPAEGAVRRGDDAHP